MVSEMVRKAHAVADDPAHSLHTESDLLPSQIRYRCVCLRVCGVCVCGVCVVCVHVCM